MKHTVEDYERYIRDLIENSTHSRIDLIEDLVARGLDNVTATSIVDKCLNDHNDKISTERPRKYLFGLFLILGAIPVTIIILWKCHETGASLISQRAIIPIGMVLSGIITIKRAKRMKQIK